MLQIATGMYFQDADIHETVHRGTFATNAACLRASVAEFPFGELRLTTGLNRISTATLEVVDRLEAVGPDGQSAVMIATSGRELLNDAAAVLAFTLNVTFERHTSNLDRLVAPVAQETPRFGAASILRRTYDAQVIVTDEDFARAQVFCEQLLALNRSHFEASMRAIRTIVEASALVADHPARAYMLYVASLEMLAQVDKPRPQVGSWSSYNERKRSILDPVLAELADAEAAVLRAAILEADMLTLRSRFVTFALSSIEPSYYREEATDARRPLRASDMSHALATAYDLRSRVVHELHELEPELHLIADRSDSVPYKDRLILSLEGLNRLARHVIRNFVSAAPTGVEQSFDYRKHLPGVVRVRAAARYWVWQADGFNRDLGPRYLEGFIEEVLRVPSITDDDDPPANLFDVLEVIERLLPAEARPEVRRPMIAMYVLWHRLTGDAVHRPRAEEVVARFAVDLEGPHIEAFVIDLFSGELGSWTDDRIDQLVAARRIDLAERRGQRLPDRIDTGLLLLAAKRHRHAERADVAKLLAEAVESLPGDVQLAELESEPDWLLDDALEVLDFVVAIDNWLPTPHE